MFQFPGRTRKNFIPENFSRRVLTETWNASCFKKGLLEKQQSAPNTCDISPLKKIFFQNLINRCICQMSLKYIKLVIPKILFILVLYIFNFNLKLSDTPQQNYPPPPLPQAKTFLNFLTAPQDGGEGYMPCYIYSYIKVVLFHAKCCLFHLWRAFIDPMRGYYNF